MKVTIIGIGILLIGIISYSGYITTEVKAVRDDLTNISSTTGYKQEFNHSVNNIIKELKIDQVHFDWIAEFLAKEIHSGRSLNDTEIFFKRKVLNKEVKFTKNAGLQIKAEIVKLKELNLERKKDVDVAMEEYKNYLENNAFAEIIDEIIFGGQIKINDIKYY